MPRRFTADEFHATRFTSAEEKAKVVNDTIRFINADAPEASSSRLLNKADSLHFGHIAYNDRSGFHFVWFATARKRLNFVEQIADRHPWQGISPDWKTSKPPCSPGSTRATSWSDFAFARITKRTRSLWRRPGLRFWR